MSHGHFAYRCYKNIIAASDKIVSVVERLKPKPRGIPIGFNRLWNKALKKHTGHFTEQTKICLIFFFWHTASLPSSTLSLSIPYKCRGILILTYEGAVRVGVPVWAAIPR